MVQRLPPVLKVAKKTATKWSASAYAAERERRTLGFRRPDVVHLFFDEQLSEALCPAAGRVS